ncbi:MAG: DUF417 family protein [Sphingomonadaceae bacterium]|nr:DUF417 family protein [Sphingomonadaceae bacterium]
MSQDRTLATPETRIAPVGGFVTGRLEGAAQWFMLYALVVIFLWFGCMKFTAYEASAIAPFIMNSPIVVWLHGAFGIAGAARFLGVYEVLTGLLIAARPIDPRVSAIGGAMAVITFLITLTFMLSTPGVAEPAAGGFPALSAVPGQFLLKDLGLLGISLWVLGASRAAARRR